jgi:hypothetical protein
MRAHPVTAPAAFADLPAGCAVSSITGQGAHDVYAGNIDDNGTAGSPLAHTALKIDSVPPTLNPTLSDAHPTLGQTGVTAAANASDATPPTTSSSSTGSWPPPAPGRPRSR